jgi:WD40 repeat protein
MDLQSGEFPELKQVLTTSAQEIIALAVSRTGDRFAVSSYGGGVYARIDAWDLNDSGASGHQLVPTSSQSGYMELEFCPRGRWLIGRTRQGQDVWDVSDPQNLREPVVQLSAPKSVISSDGRWLAVSKPGTKTMELWDLDLAPPSRVRDLPFDSKGSIAYSIRGKRLLRAPWNGAFEVWDTERLDERPATLRGTWGGDYRLFAHSGGFVAAGHDHLIVIQYLHELEPTRDWHVMTLAQGHSGKIMRVVGGEQGKWLATANHDNTISLWGPWRGAPQVLRGHSDDLTGLAFSHDHGRLFSASKDGALRVWKLAQSAVNPVDQSGVRSLSVGARSLRFSPNGRWLAEGPYDRAIKLYPLTPEGTGPAFEQGGSPALDSCFSPDGNRLYFGNQEGVWYVDLAGWPRLPPPVHLIQSQGIQSLAFHPSARYVAAIATKGLVWDLRQPERIPAPREFPISKSNCFVFCDHERFLVVSGNPLGTYALDLDQPGSTASQHKLHPAHVPMAQGSKGRWLFAAQTGSRGRLWDLNADDPARSSRPLMTKENDSAGTNSHPTAAAFSPDGHWLATSDSDGAIALWDLQAKHGLERPIWLRGHHLSILHLAFTSDSNTLLSNSQDRTVRMWDLASPEPGKSSIVLHTFNTPPHHLAVSYDGRWLATGGWPEYTRLWPLRLSDLEREAKRLAGRELTDAERREYLTGVVP